MNLFKQINVLKNSELKTVINGRLGEFSKARSNNDVFSELCFCILTANFNAEQGIRIQKEVGNGFISLSEKGLVKKLKSLGYRFPNIRSKYIIEARKYRNDLIMNRDWLVKNIKGLGYKEASHFLRNIGFNDYAIIDFHVIDLLVKHGLIIKPKTLTKNKYLEIEELLRGIGNSLGLSLGELDLYLWYLETGKVLK